MMEQAQDAWQAWKSVQDQPDTLMAKDAQFITCSAENLTGISDHSVDVVTAATVGISSVH